MGEQRPNDILYQFVDAALGDNAVGRNTTRTIVNRPDKITESYDSRRIQVVDETKDPNGDISRVITEFYEYHWAHLMRGNKLVHLLPLAKSFLQARGNFGRLTPIVIILAAVAAFLAYFVYWAVNKGLDFSSQEILAALGLGGVTLFLAVQAIRLANSQIINLALIKYLADVARYLDASPENQVARDSIRQGLVDLLDALHNKGRHRRIVVAAHSLGSIISYDALTYLWSRRNKLHSTKVAPKTSKLKKLAATARALNDFQPSDDRYDWELKELRAAYRAAQLPAWIARRKNGNPWLVTDFLTFGSPLAHAQILMAKNENDLIEVRQRMRGELARCPPIDNKGPATKGIQFAWDNSSGYPILHYAAPFSLVKWTNFFFKGDWFAGWLGPNFGYGIEDIELQGYSGLAGTWLACHTRYFKRNKKDGVRAYVPEIGEVLALQPDKKMKSAPMSMDYDKDSQRDAGDW
jgi:hypothetical protein